MSAGRAPERAILVSMPDGSQWAVPLSAVIESRAEYLHRQFPASYETMDLAREEVRADLDGDDAEAVDWLENNMDWTEVAGVAWRVKDADPVDYADGLANGKKSWCYLPPKIDRAREEPTS